MAGFLIQSLSRRTMSHCLLRPTLLSLFSLLVTVIRAQHTTPSQEGDTASLANALRKGRMNAHFRLFGMATDNTNPLTDYHAFAFGGGLKYETGSFKGFQAGVSGFFIWNLASSDLGKPDPYTGSTNRYEIGQFDIEDPYNRNDMDRLEEFYLRYHRKAVKVTFGKQEIKTPFVNPQDGRMRPTGEQGVWLEWTPKERLVLQSGWMTKISPRGTVRWYEIGESIGVYPGGVGVDGMKSDYAGNLNSAGIAILGLTYRTRSGIDMQFWDHFVDRVFHTMMGQVERKWKRNAETSVEGGFQYVFQHPVAGGGNREASKAYFDPGARTHIVSGRLGFVKRDFTVRFNLTRIGKDGRFLMPREWGREPFYTFLPRERNEGAGDVNAMSLNLIRTFNRKRTKAELSYGYYDMPEVRQSRLNKYQIPSYHHLLFDLRHSFQGFLSGLDIELLYVYKPRSGNHQGQLKYTINKVDMQQFNLVFNYRF